MVFVADLGILSIYFVDILHAFNTFTTVSLALFPDLTFTNLKLPATLIYYFKAEEFVCLNALISGTTSLS